MERRQGSAFDPGYYPDDGYYGPSNSWWWSSTGMAVRYSIVAALILVITGYFLGGYLHARARLRKGLQPMAYHRWMVKRQMYYAAGHPYARQWPQYGAAPTNGHDAYGGAMPRHAMPPPAYNADHPPPPMYPDGQEGGKIAADQRWTGETHREGQSSSTAPPEATSPFAAFPTARGPG